MKYLVKYVKLITTNNLGIAPDSNRDNQPKNR